MKLLLTDCRNFCVASVLTNLQKWTIRSDLLRKASTDSTDSLKVINEGTVISFPVKTGDLHYWALEIYPFILVVFDAKADKAVRSVPHW